MIRYFGDLDIYKLSYELAMDIFRLSRNFPKEELYSLTSQIIRSSRSVPANIAEGWSKRKYISVFKKHLLDAMGSVDETKTWLNFAKDCNYLNAEDIKKLSDRYEETGAKLYRLYTNWRDL